MNKLLDPEILIGLVFLGFFLFGGYFWGYRREKEVWNNGRCLKHKRKWRCFDMDSQGGRGYVCYPGGDYFEDHCTCWISYAVDKVTIKKGY